MSSSVSFHIFATLCGICCPVSIIGIILTAFWEPRVGLVWDHDVGPVNETRYRAMTVSQRRTFASYRNMTISFQQTGQYGGRKLDMVVQTQVFDLDERNGVEKKYLLINYRLQTWKEEKSFGGEENPSFNFSTCRRQYTCDEVDEIPCLAPKFQAVHDDFCLAQYVNRHIQPIACATQLETVVSTYALLKAAWAVRLTGFCVTLIVTMVLGCCIIVENLKEKPWIGGLTLFAPIVLIQFPGMVMALTANGRLDGMLTKTDMCPLQTQTLQELGWENRLSYGLICTVLVTVCCFVAILVYLVFSLCNLGSGLRLGCPGVGLGLGCPWRRARNTDLSSAHPSMATPMNSSEEMQPAGGAAGDDGVDQAEVQRLKTQVQQLQTNNYQLQAATKAQLRLLQKDNTKLRGRIDDHLGDQQYNQPEPSESHSDLFLRVRGRQEQQQQQQQTVPQTYEMDTQSLQPQDSDLALFIHDAKRDEKMKDDFVISREDTLAAVPRAKDQEQHQQQQQEDSDLANFLQNAQGNGMMPTDPTLGISDFVISREDTLAAAADLALQPTPQLSNLLSRDDSLVAMVAASAAEQDAAAAAAAAHREQEERDQEEAERVGRERLRLHAERERMLQEEVARAQKVLLEREAARKRREKELQEKAERELREEEERTKKLLQKAEQEQKEREKEQREKEAKAAKKRDKELKEKAEKEKRLQLKVEQEKKREEEKKRKEEEKKRAKEAKKAAATTAIAEAAKNKQQLEEKERHSFFNIYANTHRIDALDFDGSVRSGIDDDGVSGDVDDGTSNRNQHQHNTGNDNINHTDSNKDTHNADFALSSRHSTLTWVENTESI